MTLFISHVLTYSISIPQPTPAPTKSPLSPRETLLPTMFNLPKEITCILITTGTGQFDNGFLDVFVDTGFGYVEVNDPGINYGQGQVVLDECYSGLEGVQVTNTQTNAWGGNIAYSLGDKASVYSPMTCIACTGTIDTTEYIVVDGNDDGVGDTECLNGDSGNVCTLVVSSAPTAYWRYSTQGQPVCDCQLCEGPLFDGQQNTQGPAPLEDNIVVTFFAFGDTPYDKECSTCNTCIAPDGVTKQDDCEIYDCILENSILSDLPTDNTW